MQNLPETSHEILLANRVSNAKLSNAISVDYNMIDFSTIPEECKDIFLEKVPEIHLVYPKDTNIKIIELLLHAIKFPFTQTRDSYWDLEALFQCSIEIVLAGKYNEGKFLIEWCHKIENSLSNEEVKDGWRVCFKFKHNKNMFCYLNELKKELRAIVFH